jgi:hypothetical protein
MSKRSLLDHAIRIASALALLVAMTTSPLRPFHSSFLRGEPARSHWASSPARSTFPTRVVPTSVAMRPVSVKALPSETEEKELNGAARPALHFFDLSGLRTANSFKLSTTGDNAHSLHPLRC